MSGSARTAVIMSQPMRTDNKTLALALLVLSNEIYCEDGVATAAILEGSQRIVELDSALSNAVRMLENYARDAWEGSVMYDKAIADIEPLKECLR